MIQKNGYGSGLTDGPQSSWLGYSMLPEGGHPPLPLLPPGSSPTFPLLFTEELGFDLEPFMLNWKDGLGTRPTS